MFSQPIVILLSYYTLIYPNLSVIKWYYFYYNMVSRLDLKSISKHLFLFFLNKNKKYNLKTWHLSPTLDVATANPQSQLRLD